ncbi:MAG TPA: vanadium-dependent haloperoxidase [Gammaproteobacteria bacterium]|nr:vanadium-dependent haloperoxidase [Gammaproteobacteria bacterium]
MKNKGMTQDSDGREQRDPLHHEPHRAENDPAVVPSRRAFLGSIGGLSALTLASDILKVPALSSLRIQEARANEVGPVTGIARANASAAFRHAAEQFNLNDVPIPDHPCNGDEELYPNKIGNYSKGLPHNAIGEVDTAAYQSFINALTSGDPADFEDIEIGAPLALRRKLVNPQAGLAFDLEGTDSHQFVMPPAPAFASAWEAGELVENYWMSLLRDVRFDHYHINPLAQAAADDLKNLSDYRGPSRLPDNLFRDKLPGTRIGPYISQFFWLPAPFGANRVEQHIRSCRPRRDFMTTQTEWLAIQNGFQPTRALEYRRVRRYITTGRDIGEWVHIDVLFQAYFTAFLALVEMGAPVNPGNPYITSATQEGFGTFGGPYFATLVAEPATRALQGVWYQKWFVHRRLRPEMFAGRVHMMKTGQASYPIHPDVLDSEVLQRVFFHNKRQNSGQGTYFLPMAFPEGSPLHPAYGAGHATVAGACTTILKALFDGSFVIPNPVVPHPVDPTRLVPFEGPELTVEGELNKLASNVATGRNIAGVHWRTDGIESLRLGEAIAISILRDQKGKYNEDFDGFTFRKFDGTVVTV